MLILALIGAAAIQISPTGKAVLPRPMARASSRQSAPPVIRRVGGGPLPPLAGNPDVVADNTEPLITTLLSGRTGYGTTAEIFESLFNGSVAVSAQQNFNNAGFGQVTNRNAFNVAFNVPHFQYLHGHVEALTGGESALSPHPGGPEWKGLLILSIPLRNVR